MKQEGQKGPWYQDREELLFPRGHMGAFWIGDLSQGFGWCMVLSSGEGSQHQVANTAVQAGDQGHV